ncbi:MAG: hypothetical protein V4603_03755 [Pseudomonadota bacterium]
MSVVTNRSFADVRKFSVKHFSVKNFRVKQCALLLGCLLAQQNVLARSDSDPVFVLATSLSGLDISTIAPPASGREEVAAFAPEAFVPMASAARIRDLITDVENAGDRYSPRIAELAQQLGKVLQDDGQHRAALEAYDHSFQLIRRQEGLASAGQALILAAKIDSLVALGDMEASDALQQSLFSMQQKLLAQKPIALADANLKLADWNLQYYLQLQQAPRLVERTEAEDMALADRLANAFLQYHAALWLFSNNPATDALYAEKVTVERKIAAVALMVDRQYQRNLPGMFAMLEQGSLSKTKWAHHPGLSNHGSAALQRAIDYTVATAEPTLIAQRQFELADWYLLMDQHEKARDTYVAAVESLRAAGVEEQQIAAVLKSGLPVHDPEVSLFSLGNDQAVSDFDGYIDVAFDVNRYGEARNARVLAGTAHDEKAEADLLRQIHGGRFRPGFAQGAPVDRAEVTLRYYFAR